MHFHIQQFQQIKTIGSQLGWRDITDGFQSFDDAEESRVDIVKQLNKIAETSPISKQIINRFRIIGCDCEKVEALVKHKGELNGTQAL